MDIVKLFEEGIVAKEIVSKIEKGESLIWRLVKVLL